MNNIKAPDMLSKLDKIYDDIDLVKVEIKKTYNKLQELLAVYQQLEEDKELMQTFFMHQSNKVNRFNDVKR